MYTLYFTVSLKIIKINRTLSCLQNQPIKNTVPTYLLGLWTRTRAATRLVAPTSRPTETCRLDDRWGKYRAAARYPITPRRGENTVKWEPNDPVEGRVPVTPSWILFLICSENKRRPISIETWFRLSIKYFKLTFPLIYSCNDGVFCFCHLLTVL